MPMKNNYYGEAQLKHSLNVGEAQLKNIHTFLYRSLLDDCFTKYIN